jgi:hypothetical protein
LDRGIQADGLVHGFGSDLRLAKELGCGQEQGGQRERAKGCSHGFGRVVAGVPGCSMSSRWRAAIWRRQAIHTHRQGSGAFALPLHWMREEDFGKGCRNS